MTDVFDITAELTALRASLPVDAGDPEQPVKTNAERQRSFKQRKKEKRHRNIAILDMETDPFDNVSRETIYPYLAVLYSDEFETVVIWEEDHAVFIDCLLSAIVALPEQFTIYAHNGGKFDFMFLVHKLRGEVSFKGRGIMRAYIGNHEIRDSYHIIPERLAGMKKMDFDIAKVGTRANRQAHREAIIKYCISDCSNLLYFVKKFLDKFGFKISVGAAALAKLSEHYRVEKVMPTVDERLRQFFFGGRVECISGAGYFKGPLKLYDVNSMYPFVMSSMRHPIGSEYLHRPGKPNINTAFMILECENNRAFVTRDHMGNLTTEVERGVFFVSKYEYQAALELDLISDVKIIECVDNFRFTTFEKFVDPLYRERAEQKTYLETLSKSHADYEQTASEILFLKLILNNAYGKFAQNPRRYKEHYLTDPGEVPPHKATEPAYDKPPEFQGADYWIWSRPAPKLRFNNVGTAASITGGARAILMSAIHHAKNPIYCDTDSLICEELRGHRLHKTDLGSWDLEKKISELIICGKKLYAYRDESGDETIIKSKGTQSLTWDNMLSIMQGETLQFTNRAPTLTRRGEQDYISRRIKRTTPLNAAFALPERAQA